MAKRNKTQRITAEEFDKRFDEGEDVSSYLDFSNSSKKVNVDLPLWMVQGLDREAKRRGIPRQALMKTVLVEFLDGLSSEVAEKNFRVKFMEALSEVGEKETVKKSRKKSMGI